MLAAMKARSENIMVAQYALHDMRQGRKDKFVHSTPESRVKPTPLIIELNAPKPSATRWSTSPARYCAMYLLAEKSPRSSIHQMYLKEHATQ